MLLGRRCQVTELSKKPGYANAPNSCVSTKRDAEGQSAIRSTRQPQNLRNLSAFMGGQPVGNPKDTKTPLH